MNPLSDSHGLSALVAVARNGVIGRDNQLPWKLRSDLQRFKRLTMGHALVMGRKTFESIGRPLPGRQMIVLSRTLATIPDGVLVAGSLDEAQDLVAAGKHAFVVGGAEIYRQCLDRIQHMYITRVLADVEGDAMLAAWDETGFECVEQEYVPADERNEWPSTFQHWVRR
jgi:dihydrofolate reductase